MVAGSQEISANNKKGSSKYTRRFKMKRIVVMVMALVFLGIVSCGDGAETTEKVYSGGELSGAGKTEKVYSGAELSELGANQLKTIRELEGKTVNIRLNIDSLDVSEVDGMKLVILGYVQANKSDPNKPIVIVVLHTDSKYLSNDHLKKGDVIELKNCRYIGFGKFDVKKNIWMISFECME
jgi:hypothetical protein